MKTFILITFLLFIQIGAFADFKYDVITLGVSLPIRDSDNYYDEIELECSYIFNLIPKKVLPPIGIISNFNRSNAKLSLGVYTGYIWLRPEYVSEDIRFLMNVIPNFEVGPIYSFNDLELGVHTGIWFNLLSQVFIHYDYYLSGESQFTVGFDIKLPIGGTFLIAM